MADAQCFELCSLVIVRLCFCAAWFRDEHHAALMGKRSSHRSLDWHDGGSEFVKECRDHHVYICMVWFRTTQYITMISAERSARGLDWQWSHFSRSLLCLYCMGFVMNTVTTMTVEGYVPEVAVHLMGLFQFFFCEDVRFITTPCTVSSGDDHHTTMIILSCSLDGLDDWYLEVFFVRSGSCRCYVCIVPRWTNSLLMVIHMEAIHLFFVL